MAEDRTQLQIKLADGDIIVSVDSRSVRSCSEVAYALLESATVWDLSGLVIEGSPVKRQIVVRWLDQVYMALHGVQFEQLPGQPGDPTVTAGELFEFLAFADCIASSRGIYLPAVADSELRNLRLQISTHPAGSPPIGLVLDGRHYHFRRGHFQTVDYLCGLGDEKHVITDTPFDVIKKQVAEQLEKLLCIGHKLKLGSLVQRVQQFIAGAMSSCDSNLVTADMLDAIFSPRVLEAANYSEAAARRAWILSQLQQHQTLFNGPEPLLETDEDRSCLCFKGTLTRDWQGFAKDDKVTFCIGGEEWFHHGVFRVGNRSSGEIYLDGPMLAFQLAV